MTERLYYDNCYLRDFKAIVLECRKRNGEDAEESVVYLDQSAFYPTSGGQPFDTGTIAGLPVTDVYVDDNGDVAHVIKGSLSTGETVRGLIDWNRRFDHMQQHAGEHMLAGCVYRQLGGHTIGLHLGHCDSSIDVELPNGRTNISNGELKALEDEVNAHIQADEKIRCFFPSAEALSALPLRKPPTVKDHVRVVQIGDWEYCACGGTHPSTTGQVGLVKIVDASPSRGKLRLAFVCGKRAFLDYRRHMEAVKALSKLLSADVDVLPEAADSLMTKYKDASYKLNRERERRAVDMIQIEINRAADINGTKVVAHVFEELSADGLKEAASAVTKESRAVALLGSSTDKGIMLLFACGKAVTLDMSALLRGSGGKGGGGRDFARGSAPDAGVIDKALQSLKGQL